MSRTYNPAESKRGVYATLALMAALAVLSALMLAVLPGPSGGQAGGPSGSGTGGGSGSSGGGSSGETTAPSPEAPRRVEEAVRAFNDAYDFEGRRVDSYTARIGPYATEDYWSSPRGAQNLADIEEIQAAGETFSQDAELVAWEPVEIGAEEARGYATRSFTTSIGGEESSYTIRHELRLTEQDGEWLVSYGGDPIQEGQ